MSEVARPLAARLNYAQVWEDDQVLLAGLGARVGGRALSIASGGDNALALALAGAERVDAVDLSLPQLALTELKLASHRLSLDEARALFGVGAGTAAGVLYLRLRAHLSDGARGWWDAHPELIAGGLLGAGRFERYLELFRRRLLPLIHGAGRRERWLTLDSEEARRRYYAEAWDSPRWRALFRVFFSQRVMAWLGRSPEQFAQVEGPVASVLLERARRMFVGPSIRDNRYAQWLLFGRWREEGVMPAWLTPEGHGALGQAAERVHLYHRSLQEHLGEEGGYDALNLSDIFEYLDPAQSADLWTRLRAASLSGARAVWWEVLVPRPAGAGMEPLTELAARLAVEDRVPFYAPPRVAERR
ncbi:MAG: DUF3419 family protein [Deltaproteobacteria bacterium]|nr:DUF3419 family protein [Deltaproteobacteria bacterium]